MLDLNEVERAIAELESGDTKFSVCAKLADLYAVRDHMREDRAYELGYSMAPAPQIAETLDVYGNSDFLKAVSGKEAASAWAIIDDLMDTLRVVNPKVYDGVMRKIRSL